MKFAEMPYERPGVDALKSKLDALTDEVRRAKDESDITDGFQAYQGLIETYATARDLAYIRHSIDTKNAFYDAENDYFDQQGPVISEKQLGFYRAILASSHKSALEKQYGKILLDKMELAVKSSDERLIPLQQEENALSSQYEKLYAGAKIPFRGETLTVAQLTPYKQNPERAVRREAIHAEGGFFDANQEELDEIYDKLVKNRTEQARLLGMETFTPVGDIRMERLGYGRREIAACRDEVVKGVVPVIQRLKQMQAKRIGVADFCFYDEALSFADGNPKPKGTAEEILQAGRAMYRGLSTETAEFIDFMMDNDLFDVLAKPGKAPGGYCTQLPKYKAPFIFSNFNGTAGDVDVLTHEAGHAFAAYRALRKNLPAELVNPSLECCEIHSMSMEFLTSDFHELFFKEDTAKYSFAHTEDALYFLPYGCMVDEFQEMVYNQPGLKPKERNQLWLELEKRYRPWNRMEGIPFYGRGAGWQRQLHIYGSPFYYIDYVLAQSVALQFFLAASNDKSDAWKRYMTLLEQAGTAGYTQLVHVAGMRTPFEAGVMGAVGAQVFEWLLAHDL